MDKQNVIANDLKTIELSIPFEPQYVNTARLTVSSIASNMGFDYDDIEDIKVSLSEICTKIISNGNNDIESFKITFKISEDKLTILFYVDDSLKSAFADNPDDLGIEIIKALMDEAELCPKDGHILLISKILKGEKKYAFEG